MQTKIRFYFCFVLHLLLFYRSTLLDPVVQVCWCGQPQETMATSGHTLMSSSPTQHLSQWPSRQRWVETYGQTSPWTTSPTPQSVWLEVKLLKFFSFFFSAVFLPLHFQLSFFSLFFPHFLLCQHCAHFSCFSLQFSPSPISSFSTFSCPSTFMLLSSVSI